MGEDHINNTNSTESENLVRLEKYSGTKKAQAYTEKIKHFSAQKDESK